MTMCHLHTDRTMNYTNKTANRNALSEERQQLIKGLDIVEIEAVKNLLTTRINAIDLLLNCVEQDNKDYSNFMEYLLKDEIAKTYTIQKNIFKVRNMLVYAPTQVGKTKMMIRMIQDCVSNGISVIVSSDNKKDQMCQLFDRLTQHISKSYDNAFRDCFVTTADNRNFKNFIDEMRENKTFIVCCLDNKTQIQKVYEKMMTAHSHGMLRRLCLIHDEADVITKSTNVNDVSGSQPASHKKWVESMHNYVENEISVKRVFVTATPENVVYLHKPDYVLDMPIPKGYVGSDNIRFNELDNFEEKTIVKLLAREVQARHKEGGIILYCVDRNKEENVHDDKGTQNGTFESLVSSMQITGLDAVSVYNSDGIKVALRSRNRKLFIYKLEQMGIKYVRKENRRVIFIKKNEIGISRFYGYLQSLGCKVVLTIGKDLISRGISFVSDHKENPLTATTMIYRPGQQMHQVGLCQAIGRLTGTAQPSLLRRLYTTEDVYSNYMTFMNNQRQIISCIKENANKVDDNLISTISLEKGSRTIDRRILKLDKTVNFMPITLRAYDEDRMKNLIDMWWNANTIIGCILKFVYEHKNGVCERDLKLHIRRLGSLAKTWYSDLHTPNKDYVMVFCRDSQRLTRLQDAARLYIEEKKSNACAMEI